MQDGLVWDVRKGECEDGPWVFIDVKFNILIAESSCKQQEFQATLWHGG